VTMVWEAEEPDGRLHLPCDNVSHDGKEVPTKVRMTWSCVTKCLSIGRHHSSWLPSDNNCAGRNQDSAKRKHQKKFCRHYLKVLFKGSVVNIWSQF